MMIDRRRLFSSHLFFSILGVALVSSTVLAQEQVSCSASEIDDALSGLECVAEGVFISPESAVELLAERCGEAPNERACRRCFKKGRGKFVGAFKALAKLGLIDRELAQSIKDTLNESEEEVCADPIGEPPPEDDTGAQPPTPEDPGYGQPPPEMTPPPLPDGFPFEIPFPFGNRGRGER